MRVPDDCELAERFAELRQEVQRAPPPFDPRAYRGAGRRTSARTTWIAMALAAAALLIVAVDVTRRRASPMPSVAVDLDATHWRAPTDFLLATPGVELLRDIPELGTSSPWLADPYPSHSPEPGQ